MNGSMSDWQIKHFVIIIPLVIFVLQTTLDLSWHPASNPVCGGPASPLAGYQYNLSPSLLSNLIWEICSETRPIMKMRTDVVNRRALIFVKRPQVKNV